MKVRVVDTAVMTAAMVEVRVVDTAVMKAAMVEVRVVPGYDGDDGGVGGGGSGGDLHEHTTCVCQYMCMR